MGFLLHATWDLSTHTWDCKQTSQFVPGVRWRNTGSQFVWNTWPSYSIFTQFSRRLLALQLVKRKCIKVKAYFGEEIWSRYTWFALQHPDGNKERNTECMKQAWNGPNAASERWWSTASHSLVQLVVRFISSEVIPDWPDKNTSSELHGVEVTLTVADTWLSVRHDMRGTSSLCVRIIHFAWERQQQMQHFKQFIEPQARSWCTASMAIIVPIVA